MRTSLGIVAIATSLALLSIPQAAVARPDQVLAHGHDEGGVCVFDEPVQVTVAARATEDCSLVAIAEGQLPGRGLGKTTYRPKTSDDGTAAGLGIEAANGAFRLIGKGAAVADTERGYVEWHAWATWQFFDARGLLMYDDEFHFTYTQAEQDGTFRNEATGAGHCATGIGTALVQPNVEKCNWQPGFAGPQTVSFVSSGRYRDGLLDDRTLGMSFVHSSDGTWSRSCTPMDHLPVGWWTTGCDVGTEPAAA